MRLEPAGRSLSVVAVATAMAIATLGILVIAGWSRGSVLVAAVVPGAAPMQPITALCFMAFAGALGAVAFGRDKLATGLCGCVLMVCALTALEYISGRSVGLDEALLWEQVRHQTGGYLYPGRMSVAATTLFTLLALALPARENRKLRKIAVILPSIVLVISFASVFRYLFGVQAAQGVFKMLQIAYPTTLAFLIISLSLLVLGRHPSWMHLLLGKTFGGAVSRRILPVITVVPIAFCWFAIQGSRLGFYPAEFGFVIASSGSITLMVGLMLWAATQLNKIAARHDAEKDRLIGDLRKAQADALAATEAKSQFLASMSHEIRTPLNGVLGMAQAISAGSLDAEQRIRLEVLQDSGASLLAILNDILDLTKVEAGKVELEAIEFGLVQLLEGVYAVFASLASEKELAFSLDAEDAKGIYIGDPTRIRQVVSNLVSNALKFTKVGEVRICASFHQSGVRIEVSDTGPGIKEDYLPQIFTRFTQADATTTRTFGGTGLGLAICQELVALMNGDIAVSSTSGCGSNFFFNLPLKRVGDECAAVAAIGPTVKPVAAAASELKILVADDNRTNRLVIQTLLAQLGVDTVAVENGEEAVSAFNQKRWDLILMDIHMPVMDGMQAVRAIRSIEQKLVQPRTPIIALTANVMVEQIASYRAAGLDGFVSKPIELNALLSAIDAALNSSPPPENMACDVSSASLS